MAAAQKPEHVPETNKNGNTLDLFNMCVFVCVLMMLIPAQPAGVSV